MYIRLSHDMMEGRKSVYNVNVKEVDMNLGDRKGCMFNDVIYVPLTPSLLSEIYSIYRKRVEKNNNFKQITHDTKVAELLNNIHDEWENRRAELKGED